MFRFRLFGYDVDVQSSFLLSALFLSVPLGGGFDLPLIAVKMVVIFVAVLSHELGHAIAMSRYRLDPSITLAGLGGFTAPSTRAKTTRPQRILISFAGPLAGFIQYGLILGALELAGPGLIGRLPLLAYAGIKFLLWADLIWGIFNLLPILPLDGGHILEEVLGPRRSRLTLMISIGVAALVAAASVYVGQYFVAILVALFGFQNYQRLQSTPADAPLGRERSERAPEEMPGEASALLQSARHALTNEDPDRAMTLARRVLEGDEGSFVPTATTRLKAFEVVAWALLQKDELAGATEALAEAKRNGEVDAALAGSLHLAKGETTEAMLVLEAARRRGDDRREVVGPLVQALIARNEPARAAREALGIVDQLSAEDVRKMAGIAFEAGAFEVSGKLCEALFARTKLGEDAYEAARGFAKDGDVERATDMLKRAVDAGFSDRARAWSDAALEALKPNLDGLLPRP